MAVFLLFRAFKQKLIMIRILHDCNLSIDDTVKLVFDTEERL